MLSQHKKSHLYIRTKIIWVPLGSTDSHKIQDRLYHVFAICSWMAIFSVKSTVLLADASTASPDPFSLVAIPTMGIFTLSLDTAFCVDFSLPLLWVVLPSDLFWASIPCGTLTELFVSYCSTLSKMWSRDGCGIGELWSWDSYLVERRSLMNVLL